MTTAQDTFAAMLRDRISPRLRDLGFRGSGGSYTLPDERWWLLVGFQRDRYSDAREMRFTINVAALERHAWEVARVDRSWLPARPSPNTRYPVGDSIRIGNLLPAHRDRWWAVPAAASTEAVADEVVAAIRDGALPWLQGHRLEPRPDGRP